MAPPPFPPFTAETTAQKAHLAEDAWNSRDPGRGALAFHRTPGLLPDGHPGLTYLGLQETP